MDDKVLERELKPVPLSHLTKSDIVFHIINYTALILFTLSVLYPIIYCLSASFSSIYAVMTRKVWLWPVGFNIKAYKAAFEYPGLMEGFLNSLFYAAVAAVFVPSLTMITAYPISRKTLPGHSFFVVYFAITMFFNGGMIPSYLLIRDLGLINSFLAVTVAFGFSFYNVIVARTYFAHNIPEELNEAAKIDGCGDWYYFLRIVVPLSKPIIAINILWTAMGNWNGYFSQLLYFTDSRKYGIQMVLRNLLFIMTMSDEQRALMDPERLSRKEEVARQLKFAVIFIGAAPMLALYPFVQKHFVKGVMVGAIKG